TKVIASRPVDVALTGGAESIQEGGEALFGRVVQSMMEDDPEAFDGIAREIGVSMLGGLVFGGGAGAVTSLARGREEGEGDGRESVQQRRFDSSLSSSDARPERAARLDTAPDATAE